MIAIGVGNILGSFIGLYLKKKWNKKIITLYAPIIIKVLCQVLRASAALPSPQQVEYKQQWPTFSQVFL